MFTFISNIKDASLYILKNKFDNEIIETSNNIKKKAHIPRTHHNQKLKGLLEIVKKWIKSILSEIRKPITWVILLVHFGLIYLIYEPTLSACYIPREKVIR